jgi:hypothetical protein
MAPNSDIDVVENREFLEQRHPLKGPDHTHLGDLAGPQAGDFAILEADAAAGWFVEAADDVEEGRLAGAVGTYHAADLPFLDGHRDTVEGVEAAEPLADVVDLEESHQPALSRSPKSLSLILS